MQEMGRRTVTLVLGGVRSGKSRFAVEFARRFARVAFLATAKASDDEMLKKIRRHKLERPQSWRTIEEPLELARVLNEDADLYDLLLVDCLTFFASNLLDAAGDSPDISARIDLFLAALRTTSASVVLVSNEVGSGVVPAYPAGRRFRDLLGEINQKVAVIADNVVLLVAGLPFPLKGQVEVQP
jgi:adenosylcobinamide kinase / adenosylcobinamide-phosphate guanylyltransferase